MSESDERGNEPIINDPAQESTSLVAANTTRSSHNAKLKSFLVSGIRKIRLNLQKLSIILLVMVIACYMQQKVDERIATRTFAMHQVNETRRSLVHDSFEDVKNVLKQFGYKRVSLNSNWDLLWILSYNSEDYDFLNLASNKRVNQIPNIEYITHKIQLGYHYECNKSSTPTSFIFPDDEKAFATYSKQNSDKLFIKKHPFRRGVELFNTSTIDELDEFCFIQEFIDNPLLVDGYKFDIGVYAVITSLNPLRLYTFTGDVIFRYAKEKYLPFNASKPESYLLRNELYKAPWEIPALVAYINDLGLGMKSSFDTYMRKQGRKPDTIWTQIEDIIRLVCLDREALILGDSPIENIGNKNQFFQLLQFNFVVDNKLKVFLLDAKSPNYNSNKKLAHKPYTQLYRQCLYHLFNLVGVGSPIHMETINMWSPVVNSLLSSDKNIFVESKECIKPVCNSTCELTECQLCRKCISEGFLSNIHSAYREHVHRGDMKRIFPIPMKTPTEYNKDAQMDLSEENRLMSAWFFSKCAMDKTWCN